MPLLRSAPLASLSLYLLRREQSLFPFASGKNYQLVVFFVFTIWRKLLIRFLCIPFTTFFFVYHKEKPDYWNRFFLTVCICSYSHICVCLFQFNFMFLLLWHRPVKNDSSFKICRKIFLMSSWLNNPLKNYFLFVRHCGLPTATQYKFWEFCVLFWVWVWKEDIYFLFRADWNFFLGFKVKMH